MRSVKAHRMEVMLKTVPSRSTVFLLGRCLSSTVHMNSSVASQSSEIKPMSEIPGPNVKFWPLHVAKIILRPGGVPKNALKVLAENYEMYGPIFLEKSNPHYENIVVVNPEDTEAVMRAEAKYPVRFSSPPLSAFREMKQKPPGVFFADGEDWYKHRSVISKKMLRPREMSSYVDDLNQIVGEFIDHIRLRREPPGSEREFEVKNIDNALFKWSFEGVSHFVFDRRFGALQEPMADPRAMLFINSIHEFLETFIDVSIVPLSLHKFFKTNAYTKFTRGLTNMYDCVETFLKEAVEEMKESSSEGKPENERVKFLEYLLMSGKLEEDDLVASVIDLMFAGVDTTSNTVHWALYLLGRNPDKLRKLEEEIHSVLKPGEILSNETLNKTAYLKAVVKETLRLYPLVSQIPRKVPEEIVLSGYRIPANTQVMLSFILMGRDPKLFPNPESFIPERWLDENPGHSKFSSLPFGFGVRMCVGRRLAELEMHLLLARLVQEFTLQYPSNEEIGINLRALPIPEKNVPMKFYDR